MAQSFLNVTELDFDQIKANIKQYFKRQDSKFRDWDFEGSGLNMLLDVLAYNTHYNAMLAHMTINEAFIDTAQLRSSVVSQAKLLGYLPRSIRASRAIINAKFTAENDDYSSGTLTVRRGTKFSSSNENGAFTFVAISDTTESMAAGNIYNFMYGDQTPYTATGGSFTTLIDSNRNWTTNQWSNYNIYISAGTGVGNVIPIGSNTNTVITFATALNFSPDSTTKYVIYNPNDSNSNTSLVLAEGALKSISYLVDNSIPNQKFVIPDVNADISTLLVRVYDNDSSTSYTTFVPFTSLGETTGTSEVYFISQNVHGNFEIQFGDNVFGKALANLNKVELEYITTQGESANFCKTFSFADNLSDSNNTPFNSAIIVTVSNSIDGAPEESIDSIRFNAPRSLITQNRAVTANDYRAIIMKEFGSVDAINVWGGEDEKTYDPTNAERYAGQVYISIKPSGAEFLSDTQKDTILSILDNKRVMSITPNFYDPDYIYLVLDVYFKYATNRTTLTQAQLETLVRSQAVQTYNDTVLKRFDGVFRHSNLLTAIDSTDQSILNSDARVYFYKNYAIEALTSTSSDDFIDAYNALPSAMVTTYGNALAGEIDQIKPMIWSDTITNAFRYQTFGRGTPDSGIGYTFMGDTGTTSSVVLNLEAFSIGATVLTVSNSSITNPIPYLKPGYYLFGSGASGTEATMITSVTHNSTTSTIHISTATIAGAGAGSIWGISSPLKTYLKDGPLNDSSRGLYVSLTQTDPVDTSLDIRVGTVYPESGKIEFFTRTQGQVTTASSNSITPAVTMSTVGMYTNALLYIHAGTGKGQYHTISTNSTTTITINGTFSIVPDSSSEFTVFTEALSAWTAQTIKIYSRPASDDVAPSRHQLVEIDMSMTTVQGSADSIAQGGSTGTSTYTTFARDRQSP